MLDDYHEEHFRGERPLEEPELSAKVYYDMLAASQKTPPRAHHNVSTRCHLSPNGRKVQV
jgi:hypothetical protein